MYVYTEVLLAYYHYGPLVEFDCAAVLLYRTSSVKSGLAGGGGRGVKKGNKTLKTHLVVPGPTSVKNPTRACVKKIWNPIS